MQTLLYHLAIKLVLLIRLLTQLYLMPAVVRSMALVDKQIVFMLHQSDNLAVLVHMQHKEFYNTTNQLKK